MTEVARPPDTSAPDTSAPDTSAPATPQPPRHWEADVLATDGGTVHLRPITPEDADKLVSFHGLLSARTRYLRYFGPYPTMPARDVAYFTTVDHHDRVAIVAMLGNDIIAVGRYDRLPLVGNGHSAEVAFVVADAHQGRGLGSVLLEHLAAAAVDTGVTRFVAEVLAENQGMLRVFRDAGYHISRSFDGGVLHLDFAVDPDSTDVKAALFSVRTSRERASEARSVRNVLSPRSVAVIGASTDPSKVGHAVLANLLRGGFTGPVYPVNAENRSVQGVRAYASVREIPDPVDLAVVAVPAIGVEAVLDDCLTKGVKALVVVSAGFSERNEDGLDAERRMVLAARAHGMRVVGPGALGVANNDPEVNLNATLAPVLPGRGRVGFFCQSGALGIAILAAAAERGLGLSTFVSAGNRADVSGNDLMQYWDSDPDTDVVLLYLETFGNPRKFSRLARNLARTKPVIAVKSGRHAVRVRPDAVGAEVDEASVQALFEQIGVIRVESIAQLFDAALLLGYQPLPAGPRVAVVGNSSALGALAVDAAWSQHLEVVGAAVDVGANATPAEFAAAVSMALASEGVDALIAVFVPPVATPGVEYASALLAAVAGTGKPVVTTFLAAEGIPDSLAVRDRDGTPTRGSVPSYPGPERAVLALSRAVRYAAWREQPLPEVVRPDGVDAAAARTLVDGWLAADPAGRWLSDTEVQQLLGAYGLLVTGPGPATGPEQPAAGIACTVGVQDDLSFGSLVSFGLAGVISDLLGDRAYRVLPMTPTDAHDLVRAPRAAPLLAGYGGAEPADLAALEQLVLRVATLADDVPELREASCGPVLASANGAMLVEARVRLGPTPSRTDLGPRHLR